MSVSFRLHFIPGKDIKLRRYWKKPDKKEPRFEKIFEQPQKYIAIEATLDPDLHQIRHGN